jgi:hypothetical protein
MKPNLSPAQIRVLRALAEDGARVFPPMASCTYWVFTNRPGRVQLPTINRLKRCGMITFSPSINGHAMAITPAGRAYLAALGEDQ